LNGETNRVRKKHNRAIIAGDVRANVAFYPETLGILEGVVMKRGRLSLLTRRIQIDFGGNNGKLD
jgi:hypothetical protein